MAETSNNVSSRASDHDANADDYNNIAHQISDSVDTLTLDVNGERLDSLYGPAEPSSLSPPSQPQEIEPAGFSWEVVREWPDRPRHARRLAIDRFVSKPRPLQHDFAFLCRQETTNGIFEGDHCDVTTMGVTTTTSGKSIALQSFDPDHTFGIVQDGVDLIYEGELRVNMPHGYGVGSYARGERFVGIWAHGQPSGLGQLTSAATPSLCHYGWIFGTTVVHAWEKGKPVDVPLPPPPRDQPLSGLYVMCKRLEIARLYRFRHVMDQWLAAICTQTVTTSIHSRTIAFGAWTQACIAQQASIRREGLQLHSQDTDDQLFQKVKALVAHEATVRDKNELRKERLRHATLTNTTTVACLGIERRSTELVQADLDAIEAELQDAKASLLRGRRRSAKVYVNERSDEDAGIAFVCGVDGCDCQVDKTVFHPLGDPTFDD
ncbi:hypothetical protein DYB31_004675 [Aphanomyces astaci]|uniref:Uncharacterized protein n=1 Tax=Aphanomyces astaci TaxID=112090 RepID=A0A397FZ02_APHAT|nr:hypothetical protein DYB31_004675 [Aphanomyces astaci]